MTQIKSKLLFFVLCLVILLSCTSCKDKIKTKTETFHDMTFTHDTTWKVEKKGINQDEYSLQKDDVNIDFHYKNSSTFINPDSEFDTNISLIQDFDNFKILTPSHLVKEKDNNYYECTYQFGVEDYITCITQWCFAKDYEAYQIIYTGEISSYKKYLDDARDILSSVKIASSNITHSSEALKKLVGEYDGSESGYLIIHDDYTYEWYQDASFDKNNVHSGTLKCDTQVKGLEIEEGKGYYLALIPDKFIINGKEGENKARQLDFGLVFNTDNKSIRFINMSNKDVYKFVKKK